MCVNSASKLISDSPSFFNIFTSPVFIRSTVLFLFVTLISSLGGAIGNYTPSK
ncbi:hypothetical protein QEW_2081 [Clostridioides difficile CD160]|nr:hypothetical protein QEW_2081 [Clostridioides difficile CD160]